METTGEFQCSDERLNQLQKNIVRSQLSNMISVPTDCPSREKAGWTGDVQIYADTACYNQDVKEFFRGWLCDVRHDQEEDGQIPLIVPFSEGHRRAFAGSVSSAGWGDVITILPWSMYQYYGDKQILEENYVAMERWMSYVWLSAMENPEELQNVSGERKEHLKYIWNTGEHLGDWLTPSVSINLETGAMDMMQSAFLTKDIVPTLFYAYGCKLMGQISKELEKPDRQRYYERLFEKVKAAFQYEYLDENQTIKSDLQGIQVLALHVGVVEGTAKERTVEKLVDLIHRNADKLDTGFLSVPYLLDVLVDNGYRELAYKILYSEECPSWLYEVKMGATSIWESWQAVLPDGRCTFVSMAHYAFGCVGDWMYRNIVGIRRLAPGYKKILFAPDLTCGLDWAEGSYESVYGRIYCKWQREGNQVFVHVAVPFNTDARLVLKDVEVGDVVMNGRIIPKAERQNGQNEEFCMELSAGDYELIVTEK